jgi:hypothetical protein
MTGVVPAAVEFGLSAAAVMIETVRVLVTVRPSNS